MSVSGIAEYNNPFQRAKWNDGIRMELGKPGVLGILLGKLPDGGLRGRMISEKIDLKVVQS